ncbi:MAG: hypothetical protein JNL97_10975 [Verrucomicrobiales bacterium]|nr:hypothetical protein [Verrucomicrobiales bacterium]
MEAGRSPGVSGIPVSGATPVLTVAASTTAGGGVGVAARAGSSVGGKRVRVGWRLPSWLEQVLLLLLRPGNRRRSTRSTQSEFCVRSVAVAKNDLVTSDVEVVVRMPAKPAALSASCRARLLALWWSPVARRFGRWGQRNARP